MGKRPSEIKLGIIDDHIQTAVSIAQLLEYNGFKTFQAYNLDDALKKTKKEKPDLLILDIKLGFGESGYELAKELPNQKILFITGYDVDKNKLKKFSNVIGSLEKPVNIEDLLKVVRKEFKIVEKKEI